MGLVSAIFGDAMFPSECLINKYFVARLPHVLNQLKGNTSTKATLPL